MIPKIIHQLWIGDLPPPIYMMNTWKDKNQNYKYIYWNNEKIKHFIFENQSRINEMKELNGKTYIMMYEILFKYGGIFQEADSFCINKLDDYLLENDMFVTYENEIEKPGLIACKTIGSIPGHPLLKQMIDHIKKTDVKNEQPWITVGAKSITEMIKNIDVKIMIYPSYCFIPVHYTRTKYIGHRKIYAHQEWGSTYKNYSILSKKDTIPKWINQRYDKNISILIPVYNASQQFIIDCFDSIISQDVLANLEVVIINDCSNKEYTNTLINMIDLYKIKSRNINWKYIESTQNKGVGVSLNIGLKECSYEYVARMDIDDVMFNNRLRTQLEFFEKTTDCVLLGCQMISSDGSKTTHPNITIDGFIEKHENWFINHPTIMFLKSKIINIGNYSMKLKGLPEDLDLWLRVLNEYKIIYNLDQVLLWYRIHPDQISQNKKSKSEWNSVTKKRIQSFITSIINTNPFDQFDIIYYINLDKRKDRNKQILEEMNKMNFDMSKVKRIPGELRKIGALGCSISHLNALLDCQKNNYKNCLILEDDFVFKLNKEEAYKNLRKFWNSNKSWDVLMLSGYIIKYEKTNHDFLYKVNNGQTTSGYAINKHFLPSLIQNYQESITELTRLNRKDRLSSLDIYWKKLQPISNWFILYPKLGNQRPGYSDIEGKNVEYKIEFRDMKI